MDRFVKRIEWIAIALAIAAIVAIAGFKVPLLGVLFLLVAAGTLLLLAYKAEARRLRLRCAIFAAFYAGLALYFLAR